MNGICSNNSHTRSALYLESPLLLLRCRPATAWNSRIPFTKQSVLEGGDLCDPRTAVAKNESLWHRVVLWYINVHIIMWKPSWTLSKQPALWRRADRQQLLLASASSLIFTQWSVGSKFICMMKHHWKWNWGHLFCFLLSCSLWQFAGSFSVLHICFSLCFS